MTASHDFDVLIAGGGMVGASLACALGGSGLTVGVIEAVPFNTAGQPGYDDRSIAMMKNWRSIPANERLWQGDIGN